MKAFPNNPEEAFASASAGTASSLSFSGDAEDAGLVDWEFTDHETMISREKEQVEKTFGIKLTKDGFKKLTPKKK